MNKALVLNTTGPNGTGRSSGPYKIATLLRNEGWDVEVIDFIQLWTLEELKQLTLQRIDNNIKFIGFSHLFSEWSIKLEAYATWVKELWPDVKLISGASTYPGFQTNTIDYYVAGFGEKAIVVLLKYLFSNGERPVFDMDWLARGKRIIDSNKNYPAYPLKSLLVKYEDRDYIQPEEWLNIEFARGCKFNCAFCNFPVLGVKGDYSRDAEDAYLHLNQVYNQYGVTNYIVSDETFNDRTEKITKFADVVERLPFEPFFAGYVRADLLVSRPKDREELNRMRFLAHFYGVESFNTPSAKAIGKGMSGERLKEGLLDLKHYFKSKNSGRYRGTISLIIGLPHETEETYNNSLNWLSDNWMDQSFTTWPLELSYAEGVKESKMSINYRGYGYDVVDTNQFTDEEKNGPIRSVDDFLFQDLIKSLPQQKLHLWKNKDMDIFTAYKLQSKTEKLMNVKRGTIGTFALSDVFLGKKNIDERLSVTNLEWSMKREMILSNNERGVQEVKIVSDYIDKKLNLI